MSLVMIRAQQSPLSGGDSVDASVSLWNPCGTELIEIENFDTRCPGRCR
jgi:hypothetical protein